MTSLPPQTSIKPVRMTPLQALTKGPRWRSEAMRSYRSDLLLWITRGQGRITVAGVTKGFGPHNAVWIPAGTMHGIQVSSAVFGTACFLAPECSPATMPDGPRHLRIRDGAAQGLLSAHLDDLQRESALTNIASDRALDCHLGLISVWFERQSLQEDVTGDMSAAERLMQRYTDLIERQIMTGLSAGEYAAALGVTISHLSRVCRATCGRTAHDLLADRIAFEARRLLADTDLPIKRISEMLGFGSPAYFTRAFQNRTGQTPSAFRDMRTERSAAQDDRPRTALAPREIPASQRHARVSPTSNPDDEGLRHSTGKKRFSGWPLRFGSD